MIETMTNMTVDKRASPSCTTLVQIGHGTKKPPDYDDPIRGERCVGRTRTTPLPLGCLLFEFGRLARKRARWQSAERICHISYLAASLARHLLVAFSHSVSHRTQFFPGRSVLANRANMHTDQTRSYQCCTCSSQVVISLFRFRFSHCDAVLLAQLHKHAWVEGVERQARAILVSVSLSV